jgi:hypothetical protein
MVGIMQDMHKKDISVVVGDFGVVRQTRFEDKVGLC